MAFWNRKKQQGQKLTSPDGLPVVTLPPSYTNIIRLYGLRGSYGQIYRTQPNVRTVVDFLARQVASIELRIYERVGQLGKPDVDVPVTEHPMLDLLAHPAPGVTNTRLWESTVLDKCIYDVAYWQKIRVLGRVRALVRIAPPALTPERDPFTNRIVGYRSTTTQQRIRIEDLVVFWGYDPEFQDGQVSQLETLRRTLAEEAAANQNREFMWRNSSRKDGILKRPLEAPPWSVESRDAWRADWESIMSGAEASGRVGILEEGMDWVEASWNPQEMEYLGARKLTRQECSAAFGVDPRLVFAHEDEVSPELRTNFYVDRLNPLLIRLAEEIDIQLLPEFEVFDVRNRVYTQFNIEDKLKGSFVEEAKVGAMATGRATLEVNEWRHRMGYGPHPDGSGLTIPLNVLIGGQSSAVSPLEVPGDLPALGQTPGPGALPQARLTISMTPQEAQWLRSMVKAAETPPEALPAPDPAEPEENRAEALEAFRVLLGKHLARQGRTVLAAAGALKRSKTPPQIDLVYLDPDRWDAELAADLQGLTSDAESFAKQVNADTKTLIEAALDGDLAGVFADEQRIDVLAEAGVGVG